MSGTLSRRLAGVASVTINSEAWDAVGDVTYQPSGFTRETLKGQTAVEGYSEMPAAGSISMSLRDRGDGAVAALSDLSNASVIVQAANGKTIYGYGMWRVGEPPEVKTQDGTFTIKFEGPDVTESTV